MELLIARWGYLALFAGTAVEGEMFLLTGGALAHRGLLSLPLVTACAIAGCVVSDQLWFLVGRRLGASAIAQRPRWKGRFEAVRERIARRGDLFIAGFRFLFGVRTIAPLALGGSGTGWLRFSVLNLIGSALWSVCFASLGWLLGHGLAHALGRLPRIEELLVAAVVAGLVLWLGSRRRTENHRPVAASR